jgi:hypothetical protein
MPSAKYCCSGSLLKLEKGSTTIDSRGAGVSRRRGALPPVDNGGQHGAPVIYEDNPTHQTLEQLLTLASTVSLQPEPVELRRSRCFVARLRHPARGLVHALALIEGAVPLSSTFDAQALDPPLCSSKRSSDRYASPGN